MISCNFSGTLECPVRSFVKYLKRLNPKCAKLFQKPRKTPKDGIYFDNVPLGHNRIGSLMPEISRMADLSQVYTNHSIRATTFHVLDTAQIPSRHIMTVTGHKSESSLKTYSGNTDNSTKRLMSEAINVKPNQKLYQTTCTNVMKQIEDSDGSQLTELTSSQTETFFQDILNLDDDIENKILATCTGSSVDNQPECSSSTSSAMPMPVFNNCSNITLNFVFPKTM